MTFSTMLLLLTTVTIMTYNILTFFMTTFTIITLYYQHSV